MSRQKKKFYVVWAGWNPGVYDNWEDAQEQIANFKGSRFKSFDSQEAAINAYRGDPSEYIGVIREIFTHPASPVNYEAIPGIRLDAWAVDGACAKNPGPMEYRCVRISDGKEMFHIGPLDDGTNNVGEYLALVHALALLDKLGDHITPIYSDSRTALSWLRNRRHKSALKHTPANERIFEMLARADAWVQGHEIYNQVLKWDTDQWGEIPADFGRK
ncbi:MAG: ribonuclease H family protein [Clostridiales bacterium]|nr:ribonuclease H family protein [Clostridiales bacterium]